jgi:hypothetical protein
MKKQLLLGAVLAVSTFALPAVVVQARRGADDPVGHVRQEDKQQDRREDRRVDTPAVTSQSTPGTVLSQTTSTTAPTVAVSDTSNGTTLGEAVALAEKQFPTKKVEKVEKETEEGVLVWSVRFTDGSRVDVDVATGDITRIKDKTSDEDSSDSDDDDDESHSGSGRDHSEDD